VNGIASPRPDPCIPRPPGRALRTGRFARLRAGQQERPAVERQGYLRMYSFIHHHSASYPAEAFFAMSAMARSPRCILQESVTRWACLAFAAATCDRKKAGCHTHRL